MAVKRLTSQKNLILDYLLKVKTHPSIETIYTDVKKKLPAISKATVYRIVNDFIKEGVIIDIPGEVKRVDGDTSSHDHFICRKCNNIYDIFSKSEKHRKKIKNIGTVENCHVFYYGVCKKCKK